LTFNRELPLVMARRCWSPALVRATFGHFTIDPLPPIDWKKPHIYVMNHQSMLDIPIAFVAIPANLRFIAKHSLKYIPFVGWFIWFTRMVFVDRGNRSQALKSLTAAGNRIRERGISVIAYPEGTRSRDGSILPFKKGVFMLALQSQVPIVPVCIEGSGAVLPSDGFRIRPGNVRMKVGTPIQTAGRDGGLEPLMNEVREALIGLHRELSGNI